MNQLAEWLQANWRMAVAVLAGAAVVFIVGIRTESMTAVLITGFVVGILVGGLITKISGDKERRDRRR